MRKYNRGGFRNATHHLESNVHSKAAPADNTNDTLERDDDEAVLDAALVKSSQTPETEKIQILFYQFFVLAKKKNLTRLLDYRYQFYVILEYLDWITGRSTAQLGGIFDK